MTSHLRRGDGRPLVIAHRACPLDAAENSLAGVRFAAEVGADAVEVDVRLTRDGVPVLVHDRLAWRTARIPRPVRLTGYGRLARAAQRVTPDGVLTLDDALRGAPAGIRFALDVKTSAAMRPALEAVVSADRPDTMLWTRSPRALALVRSLLPAADTALLRNTWTSRGTSSYLRDAAAAGATAVSLHSRVASPAAVAQARSLGLAVLVWVVAEPAHWQVLDLDVDGVVTDWPARARALVDA